jgi:Secretion system C-terminal sorting domain
MKKGLLFLGLGIISFVATANVQNVFFANCKVQKKIQPIDHSTCPITMISTTGANYVCVGNSIALSNTTIIPDGAIATWSSANNRAVVNAATGIVTGMNSGTATIIYTVQLNATCKKDISFNVVINALASVPDITFVVGSVNPKGSGGYCKNKIFGLLGTPNGGTWTSSGIVSITSGGIVSTGKIAGAGSVTYTYTNSNGCSNSKTIVGDVVDCGSRHSTVNSQLLTENGIAIYPNPAHSIFNVKVDKLKGNDKVLITDIYGTIVYQSIINTKLFSVDCSQLVKGMYFVSLIDNGGKRTEKLIVE